MSSLHAHHNDLYLAHTEPLFKKLHIMLFPKIVMKRIALQMLKFTIKLSS